MSNIKASFYINFLKLSKREKFLKETKEFFVLIVSRHTCDVSLTDDVAFETSPKPVAVKLSKAVSLKKLAVAFKNDILRLISVLNPMFV